MAFDKITTPEDLFRELDESEFTGVAKPLASYRNELMKQGFTRREAMRLVEAYQRFIYDVSLESFIHDQQQEDEELEAAYDAELEEDDDDFEEPDL